MPTISEEREELPTLDFEHLLDQDQTAFIGTNNILGESSAEVPRGVDLCPSHPGDDCLCHGLMEDWDIPVTSTAPDANNESAFAAIPEPDYSKFENWIPRFIRPEKPCDYCKSRRLNCYLQRGEATCTPCMSLFRECSLTNSKTLEASNYFETSVGGSGAFLDTLHAVDENFVKEQGTLTGIKPLRSKEHPSGSSTPVRLDDALGSSKRNGIRFPRHAVKILRDWLDAHQAHPYPSEDEKADLERQTELKPSQIANWLANARRRRKVAEKPRPKAAMSPSLGPSTPAIAIPAADKPWDELNPLERWKHSPPENEPASITDIVHAVASNELSSDRSSSPSSGRRKRSSNGSGFSSFRAPSTTSLDTSKQSSSLSSTAISRGSSQSHGSFGSFNSSLAGKRDRRRRRRPAQATSQKPSDGKQRIFQCTFCTDTFKSKYDWTRHEKSLHLSLEKWICHPIGPVMNDPATNKKKCTFCDTQEPSDEHIESHNYRQCEDKGIDARTFYRKDHLRQHLRLMHGCEMTSFMETWRSTAVNINSRCGFCAQRFTVWQERVDHLTAHFKAGGRMSEWKGCRGLDPAVAAQVTNAMPPYLIGIEAVSPVPFSATNRATWRAQFPNERAAEGEDMGGDLRGRTDEPTMDVNGSGSRATCWEILTVRLGKYANEMAKQGVILSDEMLQQEARRILFDCDDAWNQTAADNPEWLDLFKKAHGLDFIPDDVGGRGLQVPEDLETYGDLGLRIPFAVQLQAYNQSQADQQMSVASNVPGAYEEALTKRRGVFRDLYAQLHRNGKLHDETFDCGHDECKPNMADISWLDGADMHGPRHRRWCNYEIPIELAKPWAVIVQPWSKDSVHQPPKVPASAEARHQNLKTMAQIEATEWCDSSECIRRSAPGSGNGPLNVISFHSRPASTSEGQQQRLGKKAYLQRHRYQLPQDRAKRFQTTTGAWKDSGMMPEAVHTTTTSDTSAQAAFDSGEMMQPSLSSYELGPDHVTTGAMMEFLGPDLGDNLPFSTDVASSTIQPPAITGADWFAAEGVPFHEHMNEHMLMQDLDDLIAATSEAPAPPQSDQLLPTTGDVATAFGSFDAWPNSMPATTAPATTTAGLAVPMDLTMDDLNFDDVTFDGAFDMPFDYDGTVNPQNVM